MFLPKVEYYKNLNKTRQVSSSLLYFLSYNKIKNMDKVTLERIQKLHPLVRDEVKQIIQECDEALTGRAKIRITQGLRSFEEQEKLYAIGRITSGKR